MARGLGLGPSRNTSIPSGASATQSPPVAISETDVLPLRTPIISAAISPRGRNGAE